MAWINDILLMLQYEIMVGCDSFVIYDIEVVVFDIFVIIGVLQICIGVAIIFFVFGGYNDYVWSNGVIVVMIIVIIGGIYIVFFIDSQGCLYEVSVIVISDQLFFDVLVIFLDCLDDQDGQLYILWVESGILFYVYWFNGGDWQFGNYFEGFVFGDYVIEV